MDEILASIRRIIEDGEDRAGARSPAFANADAPAAPAELRAAGADDRAPGSEVHYLPAAFNDVRSGTEEGSPREAEHPAHADVAAAGSDASGNIATADAGPFAEPEETSLDDASELRTTFHPFGEKGDEAPDESQPPIALVLSSPANAAPPAGNENALPDVELHHAGGNTTSAHDGNFEFDDAMFEAALLNDAWTSPVAAQPSYRSEDGETRPAAAQPMSPMPESVIAGASALLSAQAGDQVAAAFDDLTRAIRDGQMRSMEEMAREMMRPMLQEWLDDNLPRIVERLVRDEIERLARGPRR